MTAVDTAADQRASPRAAPGVSWIRLIAAAVGVTQLTVLGALATRGWFYQDDLHFIAEGWHSPFGWDYLTLPVNDHLMPGLRSVYWLIAHLAPYEHGTTVFGRVLVQALATLLMWRLLRLLLGERWSAVAALAFYAFSVLIVPSFLSLSSAVNLLPSHVAAIVAIDSHIRYTLTGRFRWAVGAAFAVAGGLLFWEKVVLVGVTMALLSALFLSTGGPRDRVNAAIRRWPGWLLYLVPVVLFFGYFLSHDYGGSGGRPDAGVVGDLVRAAWLESIGTSVLGGPWRWFTDEGTFFGLADAPTSGIVAGQVTIAIVACVGVRRIGWISLSAWLLPISSLTATMVLLAAGRFETFGTFGARSYHYLSELTIPLVLALVLALVPLDLDAVAARAGRTPATIETRTATIRSSRGRAGVRTRAAITVFVVVAYAISWTASIRAFDARWRQNPTRPYLTNLVTDIRSAPGVTNLYDRPISIRVATLLISGRKASEVLAPLELPVTFNNGDAPLQLIDESGQVVPAEFVVWARHVHREHPFCGYLLQGKNGLVVPLNRPVPSAEWFIHLDYLTDRTARVELRLAVGEQVSEPIRTPTERTRAGLRSVVAQTPVTAIDRVIVTGLDDTTNFCVAAIRVGLPEPAR